MVVRKQRNVNISTVRGWDIAIVCVVFYFLFFFHFAQAFLQTLISVTFSMWPGIRLLDGSVTDAMEATALTFNIHFIDIYVCSWGPRDDGAEMDGPQSLTEQALRLGAHKAQLSSLSSHCCLSDVKPTVTLSVELGLEGQNVECSDFLARFKSSFPYLFISYGEYVHDTYCNKVNLLLLPHSQTAPKQTICFVF